MYGTLELGVYGIFGSLDLSVPPENKNRGLCVFASRLVLRIFLESYGTLVADSTPLVMPLHDSDISTDILMNVPFTSCSKQPITLRSRTRCYGPTSHKREGRGAKGGTGVIARVGNMSNGTCMREDGARGPWSSDQILIKWGAWKSDFFCLLLSLGLLSLSSLSLVKSSC
jgi:hypothetical protein